MSVFFHKILHRTSLTSPLSPPKISSNSDDGKTLYVDQSVLSIKIIDFQLSQRYFQKNIVLDPLKCVFWMAKNLGKPPGLSDEVQHKKLIIYTLSLC